MLVRYKGQKEKCPVRLPIGVKSLGEWTRHGSKTVWFQPTANLTEQDALALVRLDPQNFELVVREAEIVEPDVHEGLVEPVEACQALDGTEFAEAMAGEPKKKRGRPKKDVA